MRSTLTPELREQLQTVQHDALVAMKTLIDSYLARQPQQAEPETRVQDIPID